jgi:PIN domain nuclease of toxin-antitoxin system
MNDTSLSHLDDLRAQAKYAHERYQLYRAKALGARPTSAERLRELQREHEKARDRLLAAEAEQALTRLVAPADPMPATTASIDES